MQDAGVMPLYENIMNYVKVNITTQEAYELSMMIKDKPRLVEAFVS